MHWNYKYSPLVAVIIIPLNALVAIYGLIIGSGMLFIQGKIFDGIVTIFTGLFCVGNLFVMFGLMTDEKGKR